MFAQKTQTAWKTDLCRYQGGEESSQDTAPEKSTCTITALHHHLTSAPCTIAHFTTSVTIP